MQDFDIVNDNSLDNYKKLYDKGKHISKIKTLSYSEHYKIFSLANTDIRIISTDESNKLLIPLSELRHFVNDPIVTDYKTKRGSA